VQVTVEPKKQELYEIAGFSGWHVVHEAATVLGADFTGMWVRER
jgi:hypothetical protein